MRYTKNELSMSCLKHDLGEHLEAANKKSLDCVNSLTSFITLKVLGELTFQF